MGALEQYLQPLVAISFAVPCFVMAVLLARVWRDPMSVNEGAWVKRGQGVFMIELILLISGFYIGVKMAETEDTGSRIFGLIGIMVVYGFFAAAIARGFKSRELFHSFLWLMGGRLVAILLGASEKDAQLIAAHSIVGLGLYVVLTLTTTMKPLPKFGITEEIAERFRISGASGAWADEPNRAIGAATIYFFLLGLIDLALLSWIDPGLLVPEFTETRSRL